MVKTRRRVKRCECGEVVELCDQYMAACQCPSCGAWYNLFGQALVSPDEWDMDGDDEDALIGWW